MISEKLNGLVKASYSSALDLIEGLTVGEESRDFNGDCTLEEARQFLLSGWPDGRRQLGEARLRSGHEYKEKPATHLFDLIPDVTGSMVDVGKYLQGDPECMLDFTSGRSDKLVSILYCPKIHVGVSTNAIFTLGVYLLQMIDLLESDGYRTEITVHIRTKGGKTGSTYLREDSIILKRYQDTVDEDYLTFCLCHPAFYRQCMFSRWRDLGMRAPKFLGYHLGYPQAPTDETRSEYDVIIADLDLSSQHSTERDVKQCFDKYLTP
jgi:hypothetical protein